VARVVGTTNPLGIAAALLTAASLVGYLGLIAAESGPNDWGRVLLVTLTIAVAAAAAWVGSVAGSGATRTGTFGGAGGILLGMGYLALFSIGLILIVTGLLALGAAAAEAVRWQRWAHAIVGLVLGIAAVLGPFFVST
jgi:hypothetical protein